MKIRVDYDKCAGHAVCEGLASAVFRVGEDGFTHVLVEHVGENQRPLMEDAVAECPTGALSIED